MMRECSTRRRTRWIIVGALLTPLLYCSSFLTAAFLFGAGTLGISQYQFLCDAVFAPLFVLDGENGRIEWLFNAAFEFYGAGYELSH